MIGRQNRRRDRAGPPIANLGIGRLVSDFADDAKVVQRVGEIGMEGAEVGLLQTGRIAQKPFG